MRKDFWDGARWVNEMPAGTPRATSAAGSAARHFAGRLPEAAVIVAIVGALAFGSALVFGHPAGASGVNAAQKAKVTMTASPLVVAVGQTLHLQGSGLDPTRQTWIKTETATATGWVNIQVAADGSYAADLSFPTSGTARVDLYQISNNRSLLLSSCTVTVQ